MARNNEVQSSPQEFTLLALAKRLTPSREEANVRVSVNLVSRVARSGWERVLNHLVPQHQPLSPFQPHSSILDMELNDPRRVEIQFRHTADRLGVLTEILNAHRAKDGLPPVQMVVTVGAVESQEQSLSIPTEGAKAA